MIVSITNDASSQQSANIELPLPVNVRPKRRLLCPFIFILLLLLLISTGVFIGYQRFIPRINNLPSVLDVQIGESKSIVEERLGQSDKTDIVSFGKLVLYPADENNLNFHAVGYNDANQTIFISEFLPGDVSIAYDSLISSRGKADETWFNRQGKGFKTYIFKNKAVILTTDATGKARDVTRYAKNHEFEILREIRQYLDKEDPFIM